jgi:hypothetical protein
MLFAEFFNLLDLDIVQTGVEKHETKRMSRLASRIVVVWILSLLEK